MPKEIEISLMNTRQVLTRVSISRPTLYRWIKDGKFPQPQKLRHTNRDFWKKSTVDQWLDDTLVDGGA